MVAVLTCENLRISHSNKALVHTLNIIHVSSCINANIVNESGEGEGVAEVMTSVLVSQGIDTCKRR